MMIANMSGLQNLSQVSEIHNTVERHGIEQFIAGAIHKSNSFMRDRLLNGLTIESIAEQSFRPHVTKFLGALVKPLIKSMANRNGTSRFRDNVLKRFFIKAIASSPLSQTETADNIASHLKARGYETAIETLSAHEETLPVTDLIHITPWVPTESEWVQEDILKYLLQTFDASVKHRLMATSQVSNSFLSTYLEQVRYNIQSDQLSTFVGLDDLKRGINLLSSQLKVQLHLPNLCGVYAMLAVSLGLAVLTMGTFLWIKSNVRHHIAMAHNIDPRTSTYRPVWAADQEFDF